MKIVVAGLCANESNCGDKLYIETFCKIVEKYFPSFDIVFLDFFARNIDKQTNSSAYYSLTSNINANVDNNSVPKYESQAETFLKKIIPNFILKKRSELIEKKIRYSNVYPYIRKYYEEKLSKASALVIPGGGGLVCYSPYCSYDELIEILLDICNDRRIPVYINSIGYVSNDEPKSWIKNWKKLINNKSVVDFSCRDNLEFFEKIKSDVRLVPCLACLSADYLNVYKAETNTVGVGLMRPDAFASFGNDISNEFVVNYYRGIISELLSRGYSVSLFSCGLQTDHELGNELIRCFPNNVTLNESPKNPTEFLKQIASFKGIITVRTHSAYAAFSLNVPALMFYFGKYGWESKSKEFMKMAGCPQNAICCDNFQPSQLVSYFEQSVLNGWNIDTRNRMKVLSENNIITLLKKIDRIVD